MCHHGAVDLKVLLLLELPPYTRRSGNLGFWCLRPQNSASFGLLLLLSSLIGTFGKVLVKAIA